MSFNDKGVYTSPYYKKVTNQNHFRPANLEKILGGKGSPSVLVIQEGKAEVQQNMFGEELPEVPFAACFFLKNHDPRLVLSDDTNSQLIMAAGLKITIKQKQLHDKINRWVDRIQLEKKIEDGLHSLITCGNMMFEVAPKFADIEEIDLATVTKAKRKPDGTITAYIQEPDSMKPPIVLDPKTIIHFKFTNTRREVWGRGMFHALFASKTVDGIDMNSPLISQWKMEDDMVKIFDSYASPMMMITFKDAGEQWIKKQETEFKKMQAGAKILTDKEFDAKVFEVNPNAKFDKYVEHLQTNILETGSQFPLGFFTADFTNRNAAEITESVYGRKIKRIQKKIARQIKDDLILPYIKALGKVVDPDDVNVAFELESKSEIGNAELMGLFEKGVISRSELRKHLMKKTTVELDNDDLEDTPPITSVTPTNDLRTSQPSPAAQGLTPQQQTDQLAQMQQQMSELKEVIAEKIPKPRGRPKKKQETDEFDLKPTITKEDCIKRLMASGLSRADAEKKCSKTEVISTLPGIQSIEDLENRLRFQYPDMPEDDLIQLTRLMTPIFFSDNEL